MSAYAGVVEGIDSLKTRQRHPHPWFGPMDARGWHALAATHNGLRRRQLETIVRRLAS